MNIFFDKSLKSSFIESQKLSHKDGYLVDANTQKRILDSNKQVIKAKNLGGFRKGSRIFLSKDIDTVVKEASLNQGR